MPPQPIATIDVHGYRKEQAIRQVTHFLEQVVKEFSSSSCITWVCIITGSGSHSHDGPVLRDAVQSLLQRREMEYLIQSGGGAFLVNANSGHELVAAPACPADSKIIVKDNDHHTSGPRLIYRPPPQAIASSARIGSTEAAPLPAEVAADDLLVETIKTRSAHEHSQFLKAERAKIRAAIGASKYEMELSQARREEEVWKEDEQIAKAVKLSRDEEERISREEKERFQAVLEQSQLELRREEALIAREEEERLAAILKQSEMEEEDHRRREELLLSQSQLEVSKDDLDLEQALALSVKGVHIEDTILSLSQRENTGCLDEDELLK